MTDNAAAFHALHQAPHLLILPNAWDAGTARVIESLGASAIATTSAGAAWSHGYRDGDAVPFALYLETLGRIVGAVGVPVTADIEGGYGASEADVAANVRRVFEAGVVGINIEDGDGPPQQLAAKIAAVRAAIGPALFINARTDVFLRNLAPGRATGEVIARAALYRAAGCDGIFVPGMIAAADISAVVAAVTAPLNVMAQPDLPDAASLAALGVRRFSAGSTIATAALGLAGELARSFLGGNAQPLFAGALTYPQVNALMRPA